MLNLVGFCALVFLACLRQITLGGESVVVASGNSSNAPRQPQLVIDDVGTIHVAFGQKNKVHYSQSRDGGRTFTSPASLPETGIIALGMRRGPRIAASNSAVCISLVAGEQGKGKDGDVLAFTSSDDAKTWTGPVTVNDVPGSGREGLHAMAAGPRGEMCCVWLDLRDRKTEIYSAVSTDSGKTWGKNTRVYRSPDGSVCECCHPSVAYATGGLHVMWRNYLGGARDMYVCSSADNGKTFSAARKLGVGTWPLKACPMDGGYLAASPKGEVFATWRRDADVFLTMPQIAEERRLGPGRQPWITCTSEGPYVVWMENRTGRLLLKRPTETDTEQLASNASDPVIVAPLAGQGPVIAAWEERRGNESLILCEVLAKN